MQGASSQIESARVQQQEALFARSDRCKLRKSDIVADGEGDSPILGEIDKRDLITGREDLRFLEGDLAGNVDIEKVNLSVRGDQLSFWIEHQ